MWLTSFSCLHFVKNFLYIELVLSWQFGKLAFCIIKKKLGGSRNFLQFKFSCLVLITGVNYIAKFCDHEAVNIISFRSNGTISYKVTLRKAAELPIVFHK